MDDLISRQAAIDAFLTELTKRERKNLLHTWSTVEVKYFVVDMLEKLPSAQPTAEPMRHGKWTVTPIYIKCSECGESFMLIPQNYCPNCGALMDVEVEGRKK